MAALVLVACLGVLAGCQRSDPERALRETIGQMEAAAEQQDIDALTAPLADDFVGGDSALDRRSFTRMLRLQALRSSDISATLGPVDMQLLGSDRARARFTVALTGGSGSLLPDRAQVYKVDTGWRRDGDDWTLLSATWEPAL